MNNTIYNRSHEILTYRFLKVIELFEQVFLDNKELHSYKKQIMSLRNNDIKIFHPTITYRELHNDLSKFIGNQKDQKGVTIELIDKTNELLNVIIQYINQSDDYVYSGSGERMYNSEKYYAEEIKRTKEQIESVQKEKIDLERTLTEYKNASTGKSKEIEQAQQILQTKANELEEANTLNIQYKLDEENRKKRDDAVGVWTKKIKDVFTNLEGHLKTVEDEYAVLKKMFYIYNLLAFLVVVLVVIIECCIFSKISVMKTLDFHNYIALIVPVPIAVGLLWGFITQANRAQLQRVTLAKQIHEIKYTEGLLLAINSLSIDLTDSAKRINEAIDKLLDKHLSGNTSSEEWKQCVNQDQQLIPYDNLVKILKEIKGITKV